MMPMA